MESDFVGILVFIPGARGDDGARARADGTLTASGQPQAAPGSAREAPDSTREHQTQHQAVPIPTPPGTLPPQDLYEYLSSRQPICVSSVLTKFKRKITTLMKSAVHLLASGHNLGGGMHLQTARPRGLQCVRADLAPKKRRPEWDAPHSRGRLVIKIHSVYYRGSTAPAGPQAWSREAPQNAKGPHDLYDNRVLDPSARRRFSMFPR